MHEETQRKLVRKKNALRETIMSRHGENRDSRNRETQQQAKDKHDWERRENKEEEKQKKNRKIRYKNRREVSGGSCHAALGASLSVALMLASLIAYSL